MSGNPFLVFSRTALSAAAAIVIAAPALAQNTTAAIGGRITDAGGQPVAGAAVAIRHVESGSVSNAVTDADGRYSARGLRAGGPYTLTISKGGQTERRDNVFLSLAEMASVDATLGAPTQTIVVTGAAGVSQQFNSGNMGAGTNISGRQLQALASIQRNLQDYARTDPRISQTDKERGEISAGGQNSRFNSITIDGVTTNDTFGLESNNLPTAKQPISIDSIQSVQVNISNYDVTQKGYTGANINAVTKSGTNEFKGSIYHVNRNEELSGERFNRNTGVFTPATNFRETTNGVTLGGPIIKDKLFFFGAYEELKSSRTSPDFGPIGSTRSNVGITPTSIAGLKDIAQNTWGFNIGDTEIPQGTNLTVKDTLLKLDWNISDRHRANLRYTKTEQSEPFFSNISSTSLSLSSHWYDQAKTIESVVGQWFADWTPNFSTEFKVSKRDYASEPLNLATLPYMAFDFGGSVPAGVTNATERRLHTGTERSRHFNQLFTDTLDAYLGATWNLGKHEVKFGADLSRNEIFNAFLQDANGQYKFQCESSWTYTFGNINCNTATTAQREAAVLENFQLGRPSAYQAQLPLSGKTIDDGIARWKLNNLGFFVQDTVPLTDKLTVSIGARIDQTDMPDKPIYNAAASGAVVAGDPLTGTRQSGGFGYDNSRTLDGNTLFQPRLGFNWNLGTKERRTQLRGGVGLFEGAAANVWLSNPYSNTGIATAFYGCGPSGELVGGITRANCPTTGGTFAVARADQLALGANPAPNVDFLGPDLAQPSVWKANLAFDTELPWFGLVGGVEWLHTKVKNGITYEHLNLGAPTRTGPDGRQLFYNAQGYNPACWTAAGGTVTTGATCTGFSSRALSNRNYQNVLLAKATDQGGGDALTLSLQRPVRSGWGWSAAYTYTTSKEVSPLTSSVANSNWAARSIFNPNEQIAANSTYTVRDRVSASLTWQRQIVAGFNTTFGVFYEGREGKPYSWTFNNDMNGDGLGGNDLMYIPRAPGSGEVAFLGDTATSQVNENRFWAIVNAHPELNKSRGGVTRRNGSNTSWTNSFDMRLSQEIPGLKVGHKGVFTFDILNVGNLINKNWGFINEVGFQSNGGPARSFVDYVGVNADGKYVYAVRNLEDQVIRQTRGESQWGLQLTLRYEF